MNIKVEDLGPCRKAMKVVIPVEKVNEEFDGILAMYARSARLPGFRPGKAPRDLVKKRFAKEIEEELQTQVMSSGYREAILLSDLIHKSLGHVLSLISRLCPKRLPRCFHKFGNFFQYSTDALFDRSFRIGESELHHTGELFRVRNTCFKRDGFRVRTICAGFKSRITFFKRFEFIRFFCGCRCGSTGDL